VGHSNPIKSIGEKTITKYSIKPIFCSLTYYIEFVFLAVIYKVEGSYHVLNLKEFKINSTTGRPSNSYKLELISTYLIN